MNNKIRIRINPNYQEGNLHAGVYPFKMEHLVMMMGKQSVGSICHWGDDCMPESKQVLARTLFDELPGLHTLFFDNGGIAVQHTEVFNNAEIFEMLEEILTPILEEEIMLRNLLEA